MRSSSATSSLSLIYNMTLGGFNLTSFLDALEEKTAAVSGKAGNLRGQKIPGGNMFEGPRKNEYPNKPLAQTMAGSIMEAACKELGYNTFSAPSANSSETYTNPEGLTLGACEYCGHCERFGCEANAKASPNVCVLPNLLIEFVMLDEQLVEILSFRHRPPPARKALQARK